MHTIKKTPQEPLVGVPTCFSVGVHIATHMTKGENDDATGLVYIRNTFSLRSKV